KDELARITAATTHLDVICDRALDLGRESDLRAVELVARSRERLGDGSRAADLARLGEECARRLPATEARDEATFARQRDALEKWLGRSACRFDRRAVARLGVLRAAELVERARESESCATRERVIRRTATRQRSGEALRPRLQLPAEHPHRFEPDEEGELQIEIG